MSREKAKAETEHPAGLVAPRLFAAPPRGRRAGFTLVEMLVTVAIIAVLLSLLTPALRRTIGAARGFKCQMSLRTVAFDFSVFADPNLHGPRGDDESLNGRFRLETFQEAEYGIDEFWEYGSDQQHTMTGDHDHHPLRCTEVDGAVTVMRDQPCASAGAINPPQNVSYGFNARLHRAPVDGPGGMVILKPALLSSDILERGSVPLAWDVDGQRAFEQDALPQFSTPPIEEEGPYSDGRYWFPSRRHNGHMNVAFVGGHVLSTSEPLDEADWRWGYQPIR